MLTYPQAHRGDDVDDFHGTPVADPYRWLEDSDSPETRAWIAAENTLTEAFLSAIPARERLRRRLTELWDHERFGIPWKRGGRYFSTRNDGLQPQDVLCVADSLEGEQRVLLDPNLLSAGGTVALSGAAVSRDGRLLAYSTSAAGSDWQEWRVREVDGSGDLPDVVRWVKFSGAAWAHDGSGFYYARYPAPAAGAERDGVLRDQELRFHRLGDRQDEDAFVYARPDQPEWGFDAAVTDDGRYLAIHVWHGSERRNRFFYRDLAEPAGMVVELLNAADAAYSLIDNDGPLFWFQTDLDAPRGRVVAVDVREPAREGWRTVIPESADTLESVGFAGGRFFASYLRDARSAVRVFDRDGRLIEELALPGAGTAAGFGGKRDDDETFYAFTSFTTPGTIYRHEVASGRSSVFRAPRVPFDPARFETVEAFATSEDGTRVPVFVTASKGVPRNGTNAVYLYGYGGFNIPMTPAFSAGVIAWLELGGVFAQAVIRGGGEYGEDWHRAGTKLTKQNSFDDFIAAAERLIADGWTRPEKLAIGGGSNGGLLVGACMTQRPELFGAAVPAVGVFDMLRFHRYTIGWAWQSDYGSPGDPDEFRALRAYSPLHNLHHGTRYPATLITTGDHDDRVVPAHSFKFAAALQAAHAGEAPVLIRIETEAGHGAGKPTRKIIEEAADRWAFLVEVLGLEK